MSNVDNNVRCSQNEMFFIVNKTLAEMCGNRLRQCYSLCGLYLCSKQEEHCTEDHSPSYGYFSSSNHMHMACLQVKR